MFAHSWGKTVHTTGISENVVLGSLLEWRKGEHMRTWMWATRSLEKHLEASPSRSVVCLFGLTTCLHSHSWNLGCDFRGKGSLGRFSKTLKLLGKGVPYRDDYYLMWNWYKGWDERLCLATAIHLIASLALLLASFGKITKAASIRLWICFIRATRVLLTVQMKPVFFLRTPGRAGSLR